MNALAMCNSLWIDTSQPWKSSALYKYFAAALKPAADVAEAAPLAVELARATLRMGLADSIERQLKREFAEQRGLARTEGHREGMQAVSEHCPGNFHRR